MSFLDRFRRETRTTGPEGIPVTIRPHNLPDRRATRGRTPGARRLVIGLVLASVFYIIAHYSIVAGVWPVHGTAPGAGGMLIRDAISFFAWLALLPALWLLRYRGAWGIVALPIVIFFLTRPSLFQLFTDPAYQARGSARVEANAMKAERSRITTILRTYDEERDQLVFGEDVPTIPEPIESVRSATSADGASMLGWASLLSVILAPLTMLLTFLIMRRPGALRWLRKNRSIPFAVVLGIFFLLTLFFVELGRVGGTTPWELFLPIFVGVWAAVLADDVYNLATPGTALAPRRIANLLLYGAVPLVPFLLIRELGLSVVLAGTLATMLLVGTRRGWWAGLMLVVWLVLVVAAFNLDDRSATRLQLAMNPYRDLSTMSEPEAESWAARMHQFKLFDANVLAGGMLGEGAGRGHPETAPNAADDGYITTIAAHWGWIGTLTLILIYTAFLLHMLDLAVRESSAFERSLVTGMTMLLAIPFWMAALGGIRAVPLTGVATAFAAHGGAKLIASSIAVGIVMAISHQRGQTDRLRAAGDAMHGERDEEGVRIR